MKVDVPIKHHKIQPTINYSNYLPDSMSSSAAFFQSNSTKGQKHGLALDQQKNKNMLPHLSPSNKPGTIFNVGVGGLPIQSISWVDIVPFRKEIPRNPGKTSTT